MSGDNKQGLVLRSNSTIYKVNKIIKKNQHPLLLLPRVTQFKDTKLPLLSEVLSLVAYKKDTEGNYITAIKQVSHSLHDHWLDQQVYPKSTQSIIKTITKHNDEYRKLSQTDKSKFQRKDFMSRCGRFNLVAQQLLDIICTDKDRCVKLKEKCKKEHVEMQKSDVEYYENMKTSRTAYNGPVDNKHHSRAERKVKLQEMKKIKQSSSVPRHVSTASISDIVNMEDPPTVNIDDENSDGDTEYVADNNPVLGRKRKYFHIKSTHETDSRDKSKEYSNIKHVRNSEKHVNDAIYRACGELSGQGFSYSEIQTALKVVANTVFKLNWSIPVEKDLKSKYAEDAGDLESDEESDIPEETYDNDTLPTRRAIRYVLKRLQVQSLKAIGDKIIQSKSEGATLTHATDSTTRKSVGCFAPGGIHINRDMYLPLPTIQMATEKTENITDGLYTELKMIEAASGHHAEKLYECIDLHMTDSTSHNKNIAEVAAKKFHREEPAGQTFCTSHSALGFDRGFEEIIHAIEQAMGMEKMFSGFILEPGIDQSRDTISLTLVSWVLSLFGPDNVQKPWNYYKDFTTYLRREEREVHLFNMKDARFGMISKSCAVVCYHWEDVKSFLDAHDYITNKLACLVRDGIQLIHILPVISVIAAFGIHLVSPFFIKTKGKSTHSQLKQFFTTLHSSLLEDMVEESFFNFTEPGFKGVSERTFNTIINEEYGSEVVNSIKQTARMNIEEAVQLANVIRKRMAKVLSDQRGQFYGFGDHDESHKFYVFKQTTDIDKTPINNIELERQCGDHDNRLNKKPVLATVSRDNILKRTVNLRDPNQSFRRMGDVVKHIDYIQQQWNEKQKLLHTEALTNKEEANLRVENRKMTILDQLKKEGGPFTCEEDVDKYMKEDGISEEKKQKRLKQEVIYARDSCRSLPRANLLFRILKKDQATGKRRLLTAYEFAHNLNVFLGKCSSRTSFTLEDFRNSLTNIT